MLFSLFRFTQRARKYIKFFDAEIKEFFSTVFLVLSCLASVPTVV